MRRLILGADVPSSGRVRLEGGDYRYLARALRKAPGDLLRALTPSGEEVLLRISSISSSSVDCELVEEASPEAPASVVAEAALDENRRASIGNLPPIVLLQALPKGQKMDQIVRQAAESGVAAVIPFVSDHSVSRPESGADSRSKKDRWERIVREARQQSGSSVATEILAPGTLVQALDEWKSRSGGFPGAVALLLHQDPLAQGSLHSYLSRSPEMVAMAVGPEGGFSPSEVAAFRAAGFKPILVGPNVLRTETAALFATAAVQTVLLERSTWSLKIPESPV